jgi:hypothetical protein
MLLGHKRIEGSERVRLGSESPFIGPEPACNISAGIAKKSVRDWTNRDNQKSWKSLTGLKTDKGNSTRTLCQRKQGDVNTKQDPVTMGDRSTHRILSPGRTPLQNGIDE